jgi:subtilisin family serine protease
LPAGPSEPSIFTVKRRLQRRFPGMLVDVNQRYDLAAAPPANRRAPSLRWKGKSWARWALGWKKVPERCGANLNIGVIDTSIDTTHPALLGTNIRFKSFHRRGRKPSAPRHGTAFAAMLIGNASIKGWGGLVPGARLFAANVFDVTKSGRMVSSLEAFMKAMDWMITEGVQVVNLSIAGSSSPMMKAAVTKALNNNVVLVAAADNFGTLARPAYPAAYANVLAVTAIDAKLRSYSRANRGAYIDFAMPGVAAWTAVPGGGAYQSGTSFAVPFITALAGLELASAAKFPSLAILTRRLLANSRDLGPRGRDNTFGWGFVEAGPNCG